MSLLTKATVQSSRSRGPQAMAVLGLVMMTMIITGMLLVHVQLRLKVKDLDIETPKWQHEMQRRFLNVHAVTGERHLGYRR